MDMMTAAMFRARAQHFIKVPENNSVENRISQLEYKYVNQIRALEATVQAQSLEIKRLMHKLNAKILEENQELRKPTIPEIKRLISRHFKISQTDICSERRDPRLVHARFVGFYLSKAVTLRSLPYIAINFGKRHHTTVLAGIRKIEAKILVDEHLRNELDELKSQLYKIVTEERERAIMALRVTTLALDAPAAAAPCTTIAAAGDPVAAQ